MNMKLPTKLVLSFKTLFPDILNVGGALLIAVGVCLLPVHIAYKLILLGVFSIATWYAFK